MEMRGLDRKKCGIDTVEQEPVEELKYEIHDYCCCADAELSSDFWTKGSQSGVPEYGGGISTNQETSRAAVSPL